MAEKLYTSPNEIEIDPWIVRGLDYYTRTVFEFISQEIGAQGTVCGGGRYDNLIEERKKTVLAQKKAKEEAEAIKHYIIKRLNFNEMANRYLSVLK